MKALCLRPARSGVFGNDFFGEFDSFFNNVLSNRTLTSDLSTDFSPRVDIRDTDESIFLTFELPGLNKEDIKVSVADNILTVTGEQKSSKEEKAEGYVRREIRSGSFSRSFTLPTTVNSTKVSADYRNGLLEVRLDKIEEVKPKTIEVNVG